MLTLAIFSDMRRPFNVRIGEYAAAKNQHQFGFILYSNGQLCFPCFVFSFGVHDEWCVSTRNIYTCNVLGAVAWPKPLFCL